MGLAENILHYATTTDMDNRMIADIVGCSRRHVRRVAGKWRDRINHKMAYPKEITSPTPPSQARILIFDLETSPMEFYGWSLRGPQYIPTHNIKKDWAMLSWSAKWLFDSEVMSAKVTPKEAHDRTDASIMPSLWALVEDADILIAHNGAAFDVKKMNTRFIMNGLPPTNPYRIIDTLKVSRKNFAFTSNKLDYLNECLEIPQKKETNFQLWKDCVELTNKATGALETMEDYNRNDVVVLEELYLELRPWIKSHPNVNLYIDTDKTACTNCGNTDLIWKGRYFTPAGRYRAFRCAGCGAIGRSRLSDISKEQRKSLTISVAS